MTPLIENHGDNILENPDKKAEILADNQAFAKEQEGATTQGTQDMKDSFMKTFYAGKITPDSDADFDLGDFHVNEQSQETNERGELVDSHNFDSQEAGNEFVIDRLSSFENKEAPIVSRLYQSGQLSFSSTLRVVEYIEEDKDYGDDKSEFSVDELSIPADQHDLLEVKLSGLNEESAEDNIVEFQKDFKEKGELINDTGDNLDGEVLTLIGENYVTIDSGDKELDKQEDYLTAINCSANKILEKTQNLPKDSQTFIVAMNNIRSEDPDKAYEGLKTLFMLHATSEGSKGAKSSKLFEKMRKFTDEKKLSLQKQYSQLELQLNNAKENNDKNLENKINVEMNLLAKEANEIDAGIFGDVGEIDVSNEGSPDTQKQTV